MGQSPIEKQLNEITDKIVRQFEPEKIILFGSWAWGQPHQDSDVDLFIIKETERSTREVAREIDGALWGRTTPLDLLVYTPVQVEKRLRQHDFFVRDVMEKGKVLYERS